MGQYLTKKEREAIKAKQFEIEILDNLSICEELEDIMGDSPITVEAIYEKGDEDAIALMENFMSCSPSRFDDFRKEGDRILVSVDGKTWIEWEEI